MGTAAAGVTATEVLCFRVAAETLALPAAEVAEIIRLRPVTRLPQGPASLLGLIALRGGILPVVSLAGLLGLAQAAATPAARIIVLQRGQRVGLLVDAVAGLAPAAGQRRLELAPLLARDFAQALRRAEAPPPAPTAAPAAAPEQALALLGFTLAGQHYALPLERVLEVARMPAEVTGLPAADAAMTGVMQRRGGLLPLVSLRALLGLPAPDRREARIIVARLGGRPGGHRVGLVVDALQAIWRVPGEAVEPVPAVLTRGAGEARIEAIVRHDGGRRLVSILSTEGLFDPATAARLLTGPDQDAHAMTSEDGTAEGQQFILFRLGAEHYGLPVATVDEVIRHPPALTRVPRAPDFLLGVMTLRGRVVPVIDQRRRFEVAGQAGGRGRIIVVTVDGLQAGFAVDAASELRRIAAAEIAPVPALGDEAGGQVFDRVATLAGDGRMVLLIEPRALLDRAERDLLAGIAAAVPAA
ncbi:chemotaxis protein CheW [Paeniroseomonas aquatica]|uniref:Chemotaxis protein CheW n=2 Tax=Paeniroseomonas aquatica TaxID=373043 RepID=A0ABT8A797_9PROT|nr:chemotaxis protein CheW [Paeniroseomonas aquatica]MDN3565575.1 chemotaxis protein CheW [Paeniroseomonas aquatica]